MGIYPKTDYEELRNQDESKRLLLRTHNDFSGKVTTTVYQPIAVFETRDTCYCCSCDEDPEYGTRVGSDAFCRNHGWAGIRPCAKHEMPGTPELDGILVSVQDKEAGIKDGKIPEKYYE